MQASWNPSSFLSWIKVTFQGGRRLAHLLDRAVRLLRHGARRTGERGACSVPRNHPTPAPDSPARQQAAEVKMAEYITISSGTAQRLSEKWRHLTVLTSPINLKAIKATFYAQCHFFAVTFVTNLNRANKRILILQTQTHTASAGACGPVRSRRRQPVRYRRAPVRSRWTSPSVPVSST